MTTLSQLRTDLADFSTRSELTPAQLNTIIGLAENEIFRVVRVADMESVTTLTVNTDGEAALPNNYLAIRSVTIADAGTYANAPKITYVSPNAFHEEDADNAAYTDYNDRTFYTIQGRTLRLTPKPSTDLDLTVGYWLRYDALSGDSGTNWLLTNHYDVYFYTAMSALHGFMMDLEMEIVWLEKFKAVVQSLHDSELRGQRGPTKRRKLNDADIF
jgi:hypothetical protein